MRTLNKTLTAAILASAAIGALSAHAATTVLPLDRATIMIGSPFDLKVEFDAVVKREDVKLTINGQPAEKVLGKDLQFVEKEEGVDASAVLIRQGAFTQAGSYKVVATAGSETKTVTYDVYATAAKPKAKNIIFFLGDGLSVAHRTGARLMSKGMTEGKANGRLALDDIPPVAFIGTSATNAIATDSANTMSAYMTGHKTAVNALGVYADRTKNSLDDPKVETIAEALRRTTKKSVGIVAPAELQDATPAAVVAHTRLRGDKSEIAEMLLAMKPEVVLGGGSAYFIPKRTPGSKRKNETDIVKAFKDAGYAIATDKTELEAANASSLNKVFGTFHPGNMDVTLDREFLKKGTVSKFPNQPGLVQMTQVALNKLAKNPEGFFLMVEGSSIDKMSHPMDWDRSFIETIEFDKAIAEAVKFQKTHPDTLIVVTGDHTHGISIIGTVDDNKPGDEMREKVGTYNDAGFPNYEDKNGDGYPDDVNVSKRLATFSSNFPDYYETFRPKMEGPFEPAVQNEKKQYVANEAYKNVPGAVFRQGNLPKSADTAVHAVDDIVLQATGPGAAGFRGYMEQSDVYRVLVDAFALAPAGAKTAKK